MSLFKTLLAFVSGAIAALLWLERQTSSRPAEPAPPTTPHPAPSPSPPSPPPPAPEPERVVEQVIVPDPEQAAKIEALETELAEQRAIRASEPDESHPGVDAIRAARTRALELERQLSEQRDDDAPRWFEVVPPSETDIRDLAAEHLPGVALWVETDPIDPEAIWNVLGAMQEFAESCGGAWFEFDGDFARWCAESGHPHALDPDLPGTDDARPTFQVDPRVNRSGQQVVPTYVKVGEARLYWIDDVAGETGRMHVVGCTWSGSESGSANGGC